MTPIPPITPLEENEKHCGTCVHADVNPSCAPCSDCDRLDPVGTDHWQQELNVQEGNS